MKILDLYKSILKAAGLVVTEDGFIKMQLGDSSKPAIVKGKSLVLPTTEHLKNPDWSNRVAFHPMFENILRPESDVMALYRQAANIRVNVVTGTLAMYLLRLATSPAEHAALSPDQSEFLSLLKNADEKTVGVLKKLLDAAPVSKPQQSFVHIFLKKTGLVDGKRFSRVGVVVFPLYQELVKAAKTNEVFGVKMRVKDREALILLLEYIFTGIATDGAYSRGSNCSVAPSIDVMMMTIGGLAAALNPITELYGSVMDEADTEDLMFQTDWAESFSNLALMVPQIRSIPMLAGNDGDSVPAKPIPEAAPVHQVPPQQQQFPAWSTQAPAQAANQYAAPPPQVAAPSTAQSGSIDLESFIRNSPAAQQAVMQNGPQYLPALQQQQFPQQFQPQQQFMPQQQFQQQQFQPQQQFQQQFQPQYQQQQFQPQYQQQQFQPQQQFQQQQFPQQQQFQNDGRGSYANHFAAARL